MVYDMDKAAKAEKFWRKMKWLGRGKGAATATGSAGTSAAAPFVAHVVVGVLVVGAVAAGAYLWWTADRPEAPPVQAGPALQGRDPPPEEPGRLVRRTPSPAADAPVPPAVQHGRGVWELEAGTTHGTSAEVGAQAGRSASLRFDVPDFTANFWLEGVPTHLKPGDPFQVKLQGNLSSKTRERSPSALAEVLAEGFGGNGPTAAQRHVPEAEGAPVAEVRGVAPEHRAGRSPPRFVLRAWNFDRWIVLPYRWQAAD